MDNLYHNRLPAYETAKDSSNFCQPPPGGKPEVDLISRFGELRDIEKVENMYSNCRPVRLRKILGPRSFDLKRWLDGRDLG